MQIKNLGKENGFWFQVNLETNPPILIVSDPKTQKQEYILGKKYVFFHTFKFTIWGDEQREIKIFHDNTITWWKDRKLHRENGPATIKSNGIKRWYLNGFLQKEVISPK